jgi:hypothetical protein
LPYKTFNNWLFDGNLNSPIPKSKIDKNKKIIIPDILKYNSPIRNNYVIALFLRNLPLNFYLNKYFNNINLWYLSKEEFFKFIKQCVINLKIKKRSLMFYRYHRRKLLYNKLQDKQPLLKNDDLLLLCDIIEKSSNKKSIYDSLNLEMPKKTKIKKVRKIKNKKISSTKFINQHFLVKEVNE